MSIADLGGKTILGMSGSLMDYIYYGNSFHSSKPEKKDSFIRTKPKRKPNIKKGLTIAGSIALIIGALNMIFKKRDVKYLTNFQKTLSNGMHKLFEKLPKAPKKPKTAPKLSILDRVENLFINTGKRVSKLLPARNK